MVAGAARTPQILSVADPKYLNTKHMQLWRANWNAPKKQIRVRKHDSAEEEDYTVFVLAKVALESPSTQKMCTKTTRVDYCEEPAASSPCPHPPRQTPQPRMSQEYTSVPHLQTHITTEEGPSSALHPPHHSIASLNLNPPSALNPQPRARQRSLTMCDPL